MSKQLDLIKKDLYLCEFIKKNNFSDEFIENNICKFERIYNSRIRCNGCKGLYMCNQLTKGEILDIKYDGVLLEEIEYCNYAINQKRKDNVTKAYVYCDVPENLNELDLNNIEYNDSQKLLMSKLALIYKKQVDKGLYICGDLGVGKTYLCVALCNSLVKNNEKVAFVKTTNFFNEMKAYVSNKSDLIDKNINNLKKVTYLVLDDIGSESVSEFVRDDILFRILDYRLENKLITIFTSNLNKEELLKHYQYDRKDKSNLMNARRLLERIDILSEDFVLDGKNMRRV